MTMNIQDRLQKAVKLLSQYQEGIDSCIYQLETEESDNTKTLKASNSLAHIRLLEAKIALADAVIKIMKANGLLTGDLNYDDEYKEYQEEQEKEDRIYLEKMKKPKPIVYPEDLSLPTRKLIVDLAKIELEELSVLKKQATPEGLSPMDVALFNRNLELNKKGLRIRDALMSSDLAIMLFEFKDPVEHMKSMAAMLLFLYTHEKLRNVVMGREVDMSFYYAGANLYRHAVLLQKMCEDADKDNR